MLTRRKAAADQPLDFDVRPRKLHAAGRQSLHAESIEKPYSLGSRAGSLGRTLYPFRMAITVQSDGDSSDFASTKKHASRARFAQRRYTTRRTGATNRRGTAVNPTPAEVSLPRATPVTRSHLNNNPPSTRVQFGLSPNCSKHVTYLALPESYCAPYITRKFHVILYCRLVSREFVAGLHPLFILSAYSDGSSGGCPR